MSTEKRIAGVLLPIFSLPSKYGIGTFGQEAYRFIDFLEKAGQKAWQILPLSPTGYGNSPYQSVSAFAGNPYFIDLDDLANLISVRALPESRLPEAPTDTVDYDLQLHEKMRILRLLYPYGEELRRGDDYLNFLESESEWLEDFARFMAFKKKYGNKEWQLWDEHLSIDAYDEQEIDFWKFLQYLFFYQYKNMRRYATEHGVEIIGDMPLYVSLDSADVFYHRKNFLLDECGYPIEVAGVPPDIFSSDGQRWGNPLYHWENMLTDDFAWWRQRMQHALTMYDKIRIDHFIGLVNYYAIPKDEPTAQNGVWKDAPGEKILKIFSDMGASLIAEDLGVVNAKVQSMRDLFHLPGMKILQFAFDSDANNPFLPHSYSKNCVVYGGTHDNETLVGYFSHAEKHEWQYACNYLGIETKNPAQVAEAIIRAGYASCADTVIVSMQDLMGLGNEARCNTPSTIEGNWKFRLPANWEDKISAEHYASFAKIYGRI